MTVNQAGWGVWWSRERIGEQPTRGLEYVPIGGASLRRRWKTGCGELARLAQRDQVARPRHGAREVHHAVRRARTPAKECGAAATFQKSSQSLRSHSGRAFSVA